MNYLKAMLTQCGIGPSIEKQIHEKKKKLMNSIQSPDL